MMLNSNYQIFIEGKFNRLYIYVYLKDLKVENASSILDFYIPRYEDKDFRKIKMFFWNRGIPGDFLSMYRRNVNRKWTKSLLKGASYIEASFDYPRNLKILNNPVTI